MKNVKDRNKNVKQGMKNVKYSMKNMKDDRQGKTKCQVRYEECDRYLI